MNIAHLPIDTKGNSIWNLEELFLDFMAMRGLTVKSLDAMRTRIKMFLMWCNSNGYEDISEFNSNVFRSYVRHLYERDRMDRPGQKMQHSTISRYIIVLRRLAELLIDQKWAYEDYSAGIMLPRPKYKTIQSFTPEQTQLVFDTLKNSRAGYVSTTQTALVLYLILDTGMRISEVLFLRPIDIQPSHRMIKVFGKGEKERLVPVSNRTLVLLHQWIEFRSTGRKDFIFRSNRTNQPLTSAVFRSALRTVKKNIGDELGIDSLRVSPHTFRHTFARNWIVGGGDAFSLRIIMGHSSMRTTEKYVYLWGTDLVGAHDRVIPTRDIMFDLDFTRRSQF